MLVYEGGGTAQHLLTFKICFDFVFFEMHPCVTLGEKAITHLLQCGSPRGSRKLTADGCARTSQRDGQPPRQNYGFRRRAPAAITTKTRTRAGVWNLSGAPRAAMQRRRAAPPPAPLPSLYYVAQMRQSLPPLRAPAELPQSARRPQGSSAGGKRDAEHHRDPGAAAAAGTRFAVGSTHPEKLGSR